MINEKVHERIKKLRKLMTDNQIRFYLIPTSDFHQTEAVGSYFKAREYMSGFTGSEGTLLIGMYEAKLWVDGRYFLQAEKELVGSGIDKMEMGEKGVPTIEEYLRENLNANDTLAFDGRVVNTAMFQEFEKIASEKRSKIKVDLDLVGSIWSDRPALPKDKAWKLPKTITGETIDQKLKRLRDEMKANELSGYIFSALDDIAWILNMRGRDVEFFPVVLSYLILTKTDGYLFVDQNKLTDELLEDFSRNAIKVFPYDRVYEFAEKLDDVLGEGYNTISLDANILNSALYAKLPRNIKVQNEVSPVVLWKACKNETELKNNENAHLKDAIAVTKFIRWIQNSVKEGEDIDEYGASMKLHEFRMQQDGFIEESFETIAAYRENGAIVHHHPPVSNSKKLENRSMILVDSGGHYRDGTTDVTRTIPLGQLTAEEKKCYTAVLRAMIRLSKSKFLKGCNGKNLDILARGILWDLNMDYKHGTGHGVGYILNVHEDPVGIRWRAVPGLNDMEQFRKGMVVSNEPGVYFENNFGIRIENEMVVVEDMENQFGKFMKFEPLTWIPIDTKQILIEDMNEDEKKWLNTYHAEVFRKISPFLDDNEKKWLRDYTKMI